MKMTDENNPNEVKTSSTKAVTLRVNPWWLSAVLAVGLVAVVALWRPWDSQPSASDRTVSVSGSATLKAEPDEYVFYPSYEFKNADKTVVMPAGMSDVQAQLEIIFSQIKTMNKKLYEIESGLQSVSKQTATSLDANHDSEPPMNPSDFTQKLLKLAEHVIVLEKEVTRLKAGAKPAAKPEAEQPKPPIMPI
jgi:hypothetical protein